MKTASTAPSLASNFASTLVHHHPSVAISYHMDRIIQAQVLKADGLLVQCEGPWGLSTVLTPKPHQEHIDDIAKFKWCMCVSYCKLIPHCLDAIENLGDAAGHRYFISMDAWQGFHQIII